VGVTPTAGSLRFGPEDGHKGGRIAATGTPEDIARIADSYTGHFLAPCLKVKRPAAPAGAVKAAACIQYPP